MYKTAGNCKVYERRTYPELFPYEKATDVFLGLLDIYILWGEH